MRKANLEKIVKLPCNLDKIERLSEKKEELYSALLNKIQDPNICPNTK